MSSTPFERPFALPAASARARAWPAAAVPLGGLVYVCAASLPGLVRALLIGWGLVCLVFILRSPRRRPGDIAAGWRPSFGWGIERDDGSVEPAAVLPATRVFPSRVVLWLRPAGGGACRFDLARADLPAAAHRRLRVRLRLGHG